MVVDESVAVEVAGWRTIDHRQEVAVCGAVSS